MNNLSWVQLASLMMFLGVTMGAFGSHALRGKITDYQLNVLTGMSMNTPTKKCLS